MEFFTLGQRKGLGIGGKNDGRPWFVVKKDVQENVLYVEQGEHPALYTQACKVINLSWIKGEAPSDEFECCAKFRYRQPDQKVVVELRQGEAWIRFKERQRAVTPGQSAVFYDENGIACGGFID
jgi:tRNA-specific 2-thiouridylase